jgi:hypothetical protein
MLKATFAIDTNEDKLKETQRLMKLMMYIVDRIAVLRVSQPTRVKAEKNRKEAEKLRLRDKKEEQEEALLQKKKEKEMQYYEKLKTLPPDQQRKLEEKKNKKDMLKQRSRQAKVVKH